MVKAHGRKPWILDLLRSRILGKIMAKDSYADIAALMDKEGKDLDTRPEEQAENEFVASLSICMVDNFCYPCGRQIPAFAQGGNCPVERLWGHVRGKEEQRRKQQ